MNVGIIEIAIITLFGFWILLGLIIFVRYLICLIHYKITGKNDWRYTYFGTKNEKRMFKNLNYCLEHIDEFVETINLKKSAKKFLNTFTLSENDKESILKYFGCDEKDERVYLFENHQFIIFRNAWMFSFDDGDIYVSNLNDDKYITKLVEDKLKEKGLL